jgi:hypothetical protein
MEQFEPYPLCPAGCGLPTTDIGGGPCVACRPPPPEPQPPVHDCGDWECAMAGHLVDEHGHLMPP